MRRLALTLPFLAFLVPSAHAAQLDVTIDGVTDNVPVRVLLLDARANQNMHDHVRGAQTAQVSDHVARTRFLGLPAGEYDVVAYHPGSQALSEHHVQVGQDTASLKLSLGQ
ncbi:hypothetical protein [Magnetospirillum sp. 64-120]|uniref:hypothetical protein n=1 Tax=Magnetospirillum sp. 64-120 TaxID=1895778 RepID=UPI00092CDAEF|nr:hypothetical protein [Magnetospirillum sp. 64-120]OJX80865.1 MAG: hypothetical protein BGO92_07110 [Magnetospirillum sp. 64-120]